MFSRAGYHEASVSAICREAGLANGTFYRHFDNKEEVFAVLVERLQHAMREHIASAAADSLSACDALRRALRGSVAYVEGHTALYRVGRSAESMQLGIHRQFRANLAAALREIVRVGIDAGDLRSVDADTAAYALLGILEFSLMRYVVWEPGSLSDSVFRALESLILVGYDSGKERERPGAGHVMRPTLADDAGTGRLQGGEATRQTLLAAAERLFGQAGFHATSVSGITYDAGVAQGTFYLYFPSKVAAFVELAREIGRQFRAAERVALAGLVDRRDVERVGFRTFFHFIDAHRGAYRVIREAELVAPEIARWYYESLARGYVRGLRSGMDRGEIRPLEPEPLAYALLGAGHSVALWGQSHGASTTVSEDNVVALFDILERGLSAGSC